MGRKQLHQLVICRYRYFGGNDITTRNRFLALLAIVLPIAAGAQQPGPDEVGVVRAATEYYRDVGLKRPIVIDADVRLYGSLVVSPAVIDRVVQTTSATRGRVDEHLACNGEIREGKKRRTCTMQEGASAVLAFSDLVIRGDTATVAVIYKTVAEQGRFQGVDELLTLVRGPNGQWRVERVKERGVG